MESTVAKTLCIGDDQDRISQLPNPILHHILAQGTLNTKDVVHTCILSKRWRSLWASMPHLSFDCWEYCGGESKLNFSQFVDTVLLLRDTSSVQTFNLISLDAFKEQTVHHLATWMKYAVNHNVKELYIEADMDEELFVLPCCIFTCQSLEGLALHFLDRYVYVPDVVNLCWLRVLTLGHFNLSSISLKALVSGCPVLEEMELLRCMLQDADISSNSLKKLRMSGCDITGSWMRISSSTLHALDLRLNDYDRLEVLLENLSSLAEGYVPIDQCDDCRQLKTFHDHVSHPLRFVSPGSKGPSENNMSELQTFYNLKKLELHGWDIVKNFHAVSHFLQHCPCLQQLTMISRHIAPEMESGLKKSFNCPHCKIDILAECGVDNDKILALVIDFLNGKCSCFRQYYQPYDASTEDGADTTADIADDDDDTTDDDTAH